MSNQEEFVLPKTMDEFGYRFDELGLLKKLDPTTKELTDHIFDFDYAVNKREYVKAVGDLVTKEVYSLLENEGLKEFPVEPGIENKSFIYATEDSQHLSKLLLVLYGSALVCSEEEVKKHSVLRDSLNTAFQLAFIRRARTLGYGVIMINACRNPRFVDGELRAAVKEPANMTAYAALIWKHHVQTSLAKKIFIIAHQFGGVLTMSLASKFEDEFMTRVKAIVMIESCHGRIPRAVSSRLADHLLLIAKSYVYGSEPREHRFQEQPGEIPIIAIGHRQPKMVSEEFLDSIFGFGETLLAYGPVVASNQL